MKTITNDECKKIFGDANVIESSICTGDKNGACYVSKPTRLSKRYYRSCFNCRVMVVEDLFFTRMVNRFLLELSHLFIQRVAIKALPPDTAEYRPTGNGLRKFLDFKYGNIILMYMYIVI